MALEKDKKIHSGIVNFERRRHPRISVDLPIEYTHIENHPSTLNGRVVNASEGGLLVFLSELVPVGQMLKITIYFSLPKIQKVGLTAEVVWVDIPIGERPAEFRTGLRFFEIAQEDQERLTSFLKMISP
jgi:c-di-GMP-binding flagellar brake protein YcgR